MNIKDITLPVMINYYVNSKFIPYLKDKLLHANFVEYPDMIHAYLENNIVVFRSMKIILDKSERITLGNQTKFEYELDVTAPTANVFYFTMEDCNSEIACLTYIGNLANSDLHLIFRKIK